MATNSQCLQPSSVYEANRRNRWSILCKECSKSVCHALLEMKLQAVRIEAFKVAWLSPVIKVDRYWTKNTRKIIFLNDWNIDLHNFMCSIRLIGVFCSYSSLKCLCGEKWEDNRHWADTSKYKQVRYCSIFKCIILLSILNIQIREWSRPEWPRSK